MNNLSEKTKVVCQWFLNELERVPANGSSEAGTEGLLSGMAEAAREHVAGCANCRTALRDFVEARSALADMKKNLPEPRPWFTSRVMATIRGKEAEIEEQRMGVWISVRRLAPRLVAFAAFLLLLGGTWAIEVKRAEQNRAPVMRPVDGLFETAPSTPPSDDIIASANEEQLP
jgi:hypothetical protein